MADRFYVNCPLTPGPVRVQGPEAHHLAGVCRLRPGDQVCLFNGDGYEYPAQVLSTNRRSVTLEVLAKMACRRELPFALEVAAPLPKGDRAQFLVEKLTELGVTSFVPLQTHRSVVHPRETKVEKLQRYVIEASKQCGRNVLLQVQPLMAWATYCRLDSLPPNKILAHPGGDTQMRPAEDEAPSAEGEALCPPPSAVRTSGMALAVGPEGGFTDEEVAAAQNAGWRLLDLGPRILRVETAALVLAAWMTMPAQSAPLTLPESPTNGGEGRVRGQE